MKALEDKILAEGKVLPGHILKVGSFLNHQIDPEIIMQMGEEIARLFKDCGVNKILTIETSGIPVAFAAANAMKVPMVFAKKNKTGNISGGTYSTVVHSYTHGTDYTVIVSNEFLSESDKVLIVDDFLANGKALIGLLDLINQAGATAVGAAVAIEKKFQKGGDKLRETGLRVEALASIESMTDSSLIITK